RFPRRPRGGRAGGPSRRSGPGGSHAWGRTWSGWKPFWRTFSCAGGRWPIASAFPSVRHKKPGLGGLHPKGRSPAEDGEGRRICLARNSALAEGEIRRTQPLSAERVGLKAAHNRGECAGDGLLLRPVVGARKRISEMAGALNPRRPPRDPNLLLFDGLPGQERIDEVAQA